MSRKISVSALLIIFTLNGLLAGGPKDDSFNPVPVGLSFFNNSTQLPFGALLYTPIHPGVCVSRYLYYGNSGVDRGFYQTFNLGYFYHRYAQHAVQLYTETGYRYLTGWDKLGIEAELGGGYLHAFPDEEFFTLNKDGVYEKKAGTDRAQIMGGLSRGATYDLLFAEALPIRLFLHYQFWLQYPFVNEYVPVLPNTALHVGVIYCFKR